MLVKQIPHEYTHHLRYKVLWPHRLNEDDCTIDNDDSPDTIHLAVIVDEKIICIGSLFRLSSDKLDFKNQYRLRAMATDPDYRGNHAGRVLIEYAIRILRHQNVDVLWCDARIIAVGFYQKLGFDLRDDIYEIPLIGPHKFMWTKL